MKMDSVIAYIDLNGSMRISGVDIKVTFKHNEGISGIKMINNG